jgi:tRNA A37 threonylcarbamoyltransferase TsaD
VSANHELKTQLFIKLHQDLPDTELLFPQIDHSTDNGLMTAITGYFHRTKKIATSDVAMLKADANLRVSK